MKRFLLTSLITCFSSFSLWANSVVVAPEGVKIEPGRLKTKVTIGLPDKGIMLQPFSITKSLGTALQDVVDVAKSSYKMIVVNVSDMRDAAKYNVEDNDEIMILQEPEVRETAVPKLQFAALAAPPLESAREYVPEEAESAPTEWVTLWHDTNVEDSYDPTDHTYYKLDNYENVYKHDTQGDRYYVLNDRAYEFHADGTITDVSSEQALHFQADEDGVYWLFTDEGALSLYNMSIYPYE